MIATIAIVVTIVAIVTITTVATVASGDDGNDGGDSSEYQRDMSDTEYDGGYDSDGLPLARIGKNEKTPTLFTFIGSLRVTLSPTRTRSGIRTSGWTIRSKKNWPSHEGMCATDDGDHDMQKYHSQIQGRTLTHIPVPQSWNGDYDRMAQLQYGKGGEPRQVG